jgi:hypothetical protein
MRLPTVYSPKSATRRKNLSGTGKSPSVAPEVLSGGESSYKQKAVPFAAVFRWQRRQKPRNLNIRWVVARPRTPFADLFRRGE